MDLNIENQSPKDYFGTFREFSLIPKLKAKKLVDIIDGLMVRGQNGYHSVYNTQT